ACLEATLLLLVGDREPVLDQLDSRSHQHPLELRAGAHELLVLLLGAEAHHALDARPVVPGAIEQDDLPGGGQVCDVALEVPLGLLPLRRRRERHDAADPRVRPLGDPLDHPALAGGIAPFEDHDDLQPLRLDVLLHDHTLALSRPLLCAIQNDWSAGRPGRAEPARAWRLIRNGWTSKSVTSSIEADAR